MLVAAASWDALAAELASAAENYGSVIARLTGMHWWGPASTSMLAMSAPYVEWLERTAAQTKQTATQARAAAAAFEQAHAMTVPPALVTANRAELKALIASNLLGQNTAAIAAIEAQYAEMWAQDAAAMYGYATTSAAARQLTPFSSPQQTTNPAGLAAQNAAVTQAATNSAGNTPTALSQLSSFLSQAVEAPTGWPNILPDDFTILDGIFAAYATVGVTQDIESICAGIIGAENNLGLLGAASENPAELAPDSRVRDRCGTQFGRKRRCCEHARCGTRECRPGGFDRADVRTTVLGHALEHPGLGVVGRRLNHARRDRRSRARYARLARGASRDRQASLGCHPPIRGPAHGDVAPAGGWVTRLPLSLSSCRRANPGHH